MSDHFYVKGRRRGHGLANEGFWVLFPSLICSIDAHSSCPPSFSFVLSYNHLSRFSFLFSRSSVDSQHPAHPLIVMPTPIPTHDPSDRTIPYSDNETEYQDHDSSHPETASRPSSFFSFLSTESSSRPTATTDVSEKNQYSRPHGYSPKSKVKDEKSENALDIYIQDKSDSFEEYEHEYETAKRPYPKPFYKRKKFWGICVLSTIVFLAIFIPLLLIVIIPKVAQLVMNSSTMQILQMNMTNPQERSIQVSVDAAIVGIPSIFAATVEFQAPVKVFWVQSGIAQPQVGTMQLGTIKKRAFAKAEFTQQTTFQIEDPALFGEFAKVMVRKDKKEVKGVTGIYMGKYTRSTIPAMDFIVHRNLFFLYSHFTQHCLLSSTVIISCG